MRNRVLVQTVMLIVGVLCFSKPLFAAADDQIDLSNLSDVRRGYCKAEINLGSGFLKADLRTVNLTDGGNLGALATNGDLLRYFHQYIRDWRAQKGDSSYSSTGTFRVICRGTGYKDHVPGHAHVSEGYAFRITYDEEKDTVSVMDRTGTNPVTGFAFVIKTKIVNSIHHHYYHIVPKVGEQ